MNYIIKIKLNSEAVFNSGEEDRNLVNEKVLSDENGFVYLHAKTFKGILRQRGEWINNKINYINPKFDKDIINNMFGKVGKSVKDEYEYTGASPSLLQVGNLELKSEIKEAFRLFNIDKDNEIDYKITPYELLQAQTNIRTKIDIDSNGVVKEHRTMAYHTVKKHYEFYSNVCLAVDKKDDRAEMYKLLLALIVKNINNIGGSVNRGRGQVEAELLYENMEKVEIDRNKLEDLIWSKQENI